MATADSTALAELLTKLYARPFENLVAQDNFIYNWLPKKSKKDTEYLFKVRYAGNTAAASYSENDDFGSAGHQFFLPAKVSVRQVKTVVQLSGLIIESTKGDGGYMDAWSDEIANGLLDLKTVTSDMILSASSPANSGKDLDGIPYIVDDTGTYANIDSSTYTWWKSYVNDNSGTPRNLTIALMQTTDKNLRLRPRKAQTSVIFCDYDQFDNYGNLLVGLRRYQAMEKMDGGFMENSLDFRGIAVQPVDSYPASRMDFLDKRGWFYWNHTPFMSEDADAGNVDAKRQRFKHYGNVVLTQRNRQGSLQALNVTPA